MYLNCHSFHSLRHGTISVERLVEQAAACGVGTLALTDMNTVTGIYEFTNRCRKTGIKPIVGVEFRENYQLRYIGLARNSKGIAEMNRLLTEMNLQQKSLPETAPVFEHVIVIYPIENVPETLRPNERIGIRPEQLTVLIRPEWRGRIGSMVILQPVTITDTQEYELHLALRAIDENVVLTKLFSGDYASENEIMVPLSDLLGKYADYPAIIDQTIQVLGLCDFDFEFKIPRNKKHYTKNRQTDIQLLTRLAEQGLARRYGHHPEAKARVERELKVIDELEFSGYFLITWDIIRYSNSMGFMHVGRGSGANSIVSYCLGITDVCPIELDLYFERFLNLNRKSPPDFDIDWSWKERDVILQYIFDRYGADHVAFCGTNVEFKYRSIFRELGKVFGLPKDELDLLTRSPKSLHGNTKVVEQIHRLAVMLEKFPNQRSMHSCGILISEDPITDFSALELPPKGFPIVQFDMHVAEDIGFEKFDILSQRGLGTIEETVALVEQNRGVPVNIRNTSISKDEARANSFLAKGETIGCFYIESPAMRGLLRRLKCENYKTLVAASSIIRPGVAQSGMMKEYIFRHNFPDRFEYIHEVFKEHLGETYGIMVYQEDVIKIALHYGGLSAADGDVLRRAMSGKGRSKEALQRVRDHFFESCAKQGHPQELSIEIYRQIESFAGYSFCKAHSASYAVESYQSLYLKAYYPIEFMVAAINNQGGFYRTEVYVHEARRSGAVIHVPCVNSSEVKTSVAGSDVYLGFMHLKGLEASLADQIVRERGDHGPYLSLDDFIMRVPITIEAIEILIFVGAFRFTGKAKNHLLVNARLILSHFKPENRSGLLISEPPREYQLPELERSEFEDAFDEIDLLDFPVSCSPFDLLKTSYRGDVMASALHDHHKKTVKMLAYLISRKQVPTKLGDMFFGTWIDHEGNYFDTAHFSDSLKAYPFQGGGCYLLLGTVEVDYHFPTITISKMAKMPFIPDPRYSGSDKHTYRAHANMREDVSSTFRAPYPQEVNLPRKKLM